MLLIGLHRSRAQKFRLIPGADRCFESARKLNQQSFGPRRAEKRNSHRQASHKAGGHRDIRVACPAVRARAAKFQ